MTGKKIEFVKKPTTKETEDFIDQWVAGNTEQPSIKVVKLKRTTIYLPEEIHKQLKVKAAEVDSSMTEIIITAIKNYLT